MRIAILGASRGLGAALVKEIHIGAPESTLLLSSRKQEELKKLSRSDDWLVAADFSKASGQSEVLTALEKFLPTHIFYVAGGGPYGRFQDKAFADHEWSFQVNFLFPAKVLHHVLRETKFQSDLRQFVVVGSAIAGQKPDPMASSYAGAKHGLRGLVTSVQGENPWLDVRLFEPGYIDTAMLPANAWPRQRAGLVQSAGEVARKLWHYSQSSVR
jgi:short-subunit dehydrogenase